MIGLLRELRAYRTAVAELADFNFIQADQAARGTRAEEPVRAMIATTTNYINAASSDRDRMEALLADNGIDPDEEPDG